MVKLISLGDKVTRILWFAVALTYIGLGILPLSVNAYFINADMSSLNERTPYAYYETLSSLALMGLVLTIVFGLRWARFGICLLVSGACFIEVYILSNHIAVYESQFKVVFYVSLVAAFAAKLMHDWNDEESKRYGDKSSTHTLVNANQSETQIVTLHERS